MLYCYNYFIKLMSNNNLKKILKISFLIIIIFIYEYKIIFAGDVNMTRKTNKFGVHIAQVSEGEIDKASEMSNGNGGSWGYVTVVIHQDDMDRDKWQNAFDRMREKRLIPIVRIATRADGGNWKRASVDQANDTANFLDSLTWVVRERYVTLFNEPNHAQEWGGAVDPVDFSNVMKVYAEKLREKNKDFVIMPAGLDAMAPYLLPSHQDAGSFIRVMVDTIGVEKFNSLFDAWCSHSYANPNFAGSPLAIGKATVRSYEWELEILKNLGVKNLPVFITETGWNADAIGRDKTAEFFKTAYNEVWLPDKNVRAVTPFVLDYQGEPFLKFSFKKLNSEEFYPQFHTIKDMQKEKGEPEIFESGYIKANLPKNLTADSQYNFQFTIKNTGQGLWDFSDGYRVVVEGLTDDSYKIADIFKLKRKSEQQVEIKIRTDKAQAVNHVNFALYHNKEKIIDGEKWDFYILPLPSFSFNIDFFPVGKANSDKFEVQIFDELNNLIYKKSDVSVLNGSGKIENIHNIAYNKNYRIVILHKSYLPRQEKIVFETNRNNLITFKQMLPFDINNDGNFNFNDFMSLFSGDIGK